MGGPDYLLACHRMARGWVRGQCCGVVLSGHKLPHSSNTALTPGWWTQGQMPYGHQGALGSSMAYWPQAEPTVVAAALGSVPVWGFGVRPSIPLAVATAPLEGWDPPLSL